MEEKISISLQEYNELKRKADTYDRSQGIRHKNSLVPYLCSCASLPIALPS